MKFIICFSFLYFPTGYSGNNCSDSVNVRLFDFCVYSHVTVEFVIILHVGCVLTTVNICNVIVVCRSVHMYENKAYDMNLFNFLLIQINVISNEQVCYYSHFYNTELLFTFHFSCLSYNKQIIFLKSFLSIIYRSNILF